MGNHNENKNLEKILEKEEKYTVELSGKQIAKICVSLHSEIENYREILDNYDMLPESEKELGKEEIEKMLRENKIMIEKLTNTHYPVFEMAISD